MWVDGIDIVHIAEIAPPQPPTVTDPHSALRSLIRSIGPQGALAILAQGHHAIRLWREESGRRPRTEFASPPTPSPPTPSSPPKLLLLGWDAADWRIINPLLLRGAMPALQKLIEQGTRGSIATLTPPLSPILWTSIATGKRAWQHGVGGFVEADPDGPGLRPIRSHARRVKALWNILQHKGIKSHVVGWWPSHPADPLPEGAMVSNFFQKESPDPAQWPLPEGAVHPPQWAAALAELRVHPSEISLGMILPFVPTAQPEDLRTDPVVQNVARFLAHCASIQSAATFLLEQGGSDLSAFYFDAIDHFSHLAMRYHPPRLDGIDEAKYEKYKGIVEGAYRFHDMMLEALLLKIGPETPVLLLSDHGFRSEANRPRRLPKEPAAPMHEHRTYGILLGSRGPFARGQTLFGARLLDICPTVLHFFDLPVGEDMEGRVLMELFAPGQLREAPRSIPSWEAVEGECGMHSPLAPASPHSPTESLGMQQLVELGYIEAVPEGGAEAHREHMLRENRYNLALTLLDAGRFAEALPEFEQLVEEDPKAVRYWERLIKALLAMGQPRKAREALGKAAQSGLNLEGPRLSVLGVLVDLGLRQFDQAELRLAKLTRDHPHDALLLEQLARISVGRRRWDQALEHYEAVLRIDPDEVRGLNGKANCLMELGRFEEALDPLFDSVERHFRQPRVHHWIGTTLRRLNKPREALSALRLAHQLRPGDLGILESLVSLGRELGVETEMEVWEKALETLRLPPVVVVSGWPRSGTSLMMQLLSAAGMEAYTDEARSPDEHNPRGYFEHSAVKKLRYDRSWTPQARGKVVKVVSALLPELPLTERYKVIYLQRPLSEVLLSQQKMLGKRTDRLLRDYPLALANALTQQQERALHWARRHPQVELLEVPLEALYGCEPDWVETLSEFTGVAFDPDHFWDPLDADLRRVKL